MSVPKIPLVITEDRREKKESAGCTWDDALDAGLDVLVKKAEKSSKKKEQSHA